MQHMQAHKSHVLSRYRELLRLVQRLPADKAGAAKAEAQQTIRQRQAETDPQARLQHVKELVAKISFLRITTPRPVGEKLEAGSYLLRQGQLVKGTGEEKGTRVTDGSVNMDDAKRLNMEHYRRIYGKPMPKEMFF